MRVDGIIQSVAVDDRYQSDVWDCMLPTSRPEHLLILGFGGGTIATLATRKWGSVPTTGIERDPDIARLALDEFGLKDLAHVSVVVQDAFEFMAQTRRTYDAICIDLFVGGKLIHGVLGAQFLKDVGRALGHNGTAMINLWASSYLSDQIRRIEQELRIERIDRIGGNVVIRCSSRTDDS